MSTRLWSIAVAACALACGSCGNSSGLYPVSGKVTFNGEPAAGASVSFVRKGGDPAKELTPQGVVGEDGSFTLSGPGGDGAAPGDYAVLVEWKEGAGKQKGRSPGLAAPDRLKQRYLDPTRPLLSARVDAKTNRLAPFELK